MSSTCTGWPSPRFLLIATFNPSKYSRFYKNTPQRILSYRLLRYMLLLSHVEIVIILTGSTHFTAWLFSKGAFFDHLRTYPFIVMQHISIGRPENIYTHQLTFQLDFVKTHFSPNYLYITELLQKKILIHYKNGNVARQITGQTFLSGSLSLEQLSI